VEVLEVTAPAPPHNTIPEVAADSLSAALLIGFVGLLFLGYFDPGFPYNSLATVPLVGSFGILLVMNRRADKADRARPA
jgi:hypothetical protein